MNAAELKINAHTFTPLNYLDWQDRLQEMLLKNLSNADTADRLILEDVGTGTGPEALHIGTSVTNVDESSL